MFAFLLLVLLLVAGAAAVLLFFLIRIGTRSQAGYVADHLVFVDDKDHSEEELMEIYGIDKQDRHYAFGSMALFDTLEEAIAYARTVPPRSRPSRASRRA